MKKSKLPTVASFCAKKNYTKIINIWAKQILAFQPTVTLYLYFPLSEVKNTDSCQLKKADILNSGLCWQQALQPKLSSHPFFGVQTGQALSADLHYHFNFLNSFQLPLRDFYVLCYFTRGPELKTCNNMTYAAYFRTYKHGGLVGSDPHFNHFDNGNSGNTNEKRL